jgi:hypothetical protein
MKKNEYSAFKLHPLVKGAIREAVTRALRANPVRLHLATAGTNKKEVSFPVYEMDGEVWSEGSAVDKILGEYSWWNETEE